MPSVRYILLSAEAAVRRLPRSLVMSWFLRYRCWDFLCFYREVTHGERMMACADKLREQTAGATGELLERSSAFDY